MNTEPATSRLPDSKPPMLPPRRGSTGRTPNVQANPPTAGNVVTSHGRAASQGSSDSSHGELPHPQSVRRPSADRMPSFLPPGAAPPHDARSILYPALPVMTSPQSAHSYQSTPPHPPPKTMQYSQQSNNSPSPTITPLSTTSTTTPLNAPSRLNSQNSAKYLPSPLNPNMGPSTAPSGSRQPSSSSTMPPSLSSDENPEKGNGGGIIEKLTRRRKRTKKNDSEDFTLPPPQRPPSMVLSRLLREEAESAANANWIGMPGRSGSAPAGFGGTRPASMILYRLADEEDRIWTGSENLPPAQLPARPASFHSLAPPPSNRFSSSRMSGISTSSSSDSKYPTFHIHTNVPQPYNGEGSPNPSPTLTGKALNRTPSFSSQPPSRPNSMAFRPPTPAGTPPPTTPLSHGVFLPYEYDPADDQEGPDDEVDELHHVELVDGKWKAEGMADVNPRGLINVFCVLFVISAILGVFLAYPIVDGYRREWEYLANKNGAVIVNSVGGKDSLSTTTSLDDTVTTTTDFLLTTPGTTPTRTRTRTTIQPSTSEEAEPTSDLDTADPISTTSDLVTPTSLIAPISTLLGVAGRRFGGI